MKIFVNKFLIILVILSSVIFLGLECHWPGDGDGDAGDGTGTSASEPVENLSTNTDATVVTIDVTTMEVETDDGVILTCDLPTDVVLIIGDRVEIVIDFESNESQWVITHTEFFQKL